MLNGAASGRQRCLEPLTADGAQAVDDFLERLHRGVYT